MNQFQKWANRNKPPVKTKVVRDPVDYYIPDEEVIDPPTIIEIVFSLIFGSIAIILILWFLASVQIYFNLDT